LKVSVLIPKHRKAMVFNSLFGFNRPSAVHTVEERDSTTGGGGMDERNLAQNSEQLKEAEKEHHQRQKGSPVSDAEARILRAVSKSSINSTEDENWARLAGFGLGIGSLYVQEALTYPICIIRRQCQVNHAALKYHLTPFTIFQLIIKIQKTQGMGALWKGWGTSFVFQGIVILTEIGISEVMNVPRDLTSEEKVGIQAILGNQILKCLGLVLTLPFYSASLVDSIQSFQLGENRSLLDFLKDVLYRLAGRYKARGHGRLLPMYQLIAPTLLHSMLRYAMTSLIQNAIIKRSSVKVQNKKPKGDIAVEAGKTYYTQLLAGFLSSLVVDLLLYPLETIVLRLHVQGTRTIIDDTDNGYGVVPLCTSYNGMKDCAQAICREEGASALFKGLGALVVQFVIQACVLKLTKAIFKRLPQSSEGPLAKK